MRLFYNCSQIMLALEAILGTLLVMNHILYLIFILFSLLSWIQQHHQQTPFAWFCPKCCKFSEGWQLLGKCSLIHWLWYLEEPLKDSCGLLGSHGSTCVIGIPGFCLELVPLQGLELGDDMSLGVYVCGNRRDWSPHSWGLVTCGAPPSGLS